ncbi:polysaccharide biosynthesis protein [Streptacidiphilus sp. EB129]|uniref:polysaccharide biosynthesis protein n=1 Tax=Streptacidiphilus sp. EB129 TaxID=3156262 RepID=UPI003511B3F5
MTDGRPPRGTTGLRTLIVGAGQAGRALARDLLRVPEFGLAPVGFLDDDPDKPGSGPLPRLGALDQTGPAVTAHRIEAVVVAIPGLPAERFHQVAAAGATAGASVRYLPSFTAALRHDPRGTDRLPDPRSALGGSGGGGTLDISRLIGRQDPTAAGPEAVGPDAVSAEARDAVAGRRVLVTGAGGSIGSALCRALRALGPERLFRLDHDGSNLYGCNLYGQARDDDVVISDIRDRARLEQVFHQLRPDLVFHTAAHHHLAMLEHHPCEGVKSNVLGTDHLVQVAMKTGVERFVLVSTDKAADPVSVLGATKRLAESLVQARHTASTVFAAVRLGDVLDSRSSPLAALSAQLRSGAPVTVAHPDLTRFYLTVDEATALVLEAAGLATGGEVFVLELGAPVRALDLVHRLAEQLGTEQPQIGFTGLRPGEKLNEALFSERERRRPTTHPRIRAAVPYSPRELGFIPLGLPGLYAAAERNNAAEVRSRLARLLPGFPPPERTAPSATAERQLVPAATPYAGGI